MPEADADHYRLFQDEHGRHYGLVLKEAHGQRLWLDGELQPVFDRVTFELNKP